MDCSFITSINSILDRFDFRMSEFQERFYIYVDISLELVDPSLRFGQLCFKSVIQFLTFFYFTFQIFDSFKNGTPFLSRNHDAFTILFFRGIRPSWFALLNFFRPYFCFGVEHAEKRLTRTVTFLFSELTKLVLFGKIVCIWAKLVLFGQSVCIWDNRFISGKLVVFGQNWFYLGKLVIFRQNWLYSGKLVVFGQNWFYSGKLVVFGQNWLYLGKLVLFRQTGCIWVKLAVFGQIGSIWANWFYLGKLVVFGQKWFYLDRRWMY